MQKDSQVLKPLNDREKEALRSILGMVVPYTIDISMGDVRKYLFEGYNRDEVIERILNETSHDPLTTVKLRLIYAELDRCYRIEAENVSPSISD